MANLNILLKATSGGLEVSGIWPPFSQNLSKEAFIREGDLLEYIQYLDNYSLYNMQYTNTGAKQIVFKEIQFTLP